MSTKAKRRAATNWNKLRRMTPAQIRRGILADPEAHPTDKAFWKNAKVVMPVPKEIVTMRLDADLLRWFRQQRGYQTRINAILRAYMNAQHVESGRPRPLPLHLIGDGCIAAKR
jgi:uncharacterized protein (DUF4415 family)